jgi:hypothetical protein
LCRQSACILVLLILAFGVSSLALIIC